MKKSTNYICPIFCIAMFLIIEGSVGILIGLFEGLTSEMTWWGISKFMGMITFMSLIGGGSMAAAMLDTPDPKKLITMPVNGAISTLLAGAVLFIGSIYQMNYFVLNVIYLSASLLGLGLIIMAILSLININTLDI